MGIDYPEEIMLVLYIYIYITDSICNAIPLYSLGWSDKQVSDSIREDRKPQQTEESLRVGLNDKAVQCCAGDADARLA